MMMQQTLQSKRRNRRISVDAVTTTNQNENGVVVLVQTRTCNNRAFAETVPSVQSTSLSSYHHDRKVSRSRREGSNERSNITLSSSSPSSRRRRHPQCFRMLQQTKMMVSMLLLLLINMMLLPGLQFLPVPVQAQQQEKQRRPRILYIVTTLAEYNSGTRNTERGSDRLQLTLIPVVSEGIRSMIAAGYDVDLFLVCHFTLTPEREALVRHALPPNVGFDTWYDATPLGYDTGKEPFTKLENRTLHLARQHRFVIKDKLLYYDIFACFEDDMLIKGEHVQHFVAVTEEIERLKQHAPDELPDKSRSKSEAMDHYHGVMTKAQLKRTIPGFIRVEVLLDEDEYPAQKDTGPVPVDLDFGAEAGKPNSVDSSVCCHVSEEATGESRPMHPDADKLMLWETNIMPLGVRKMPDDSWLDWVVCQRGPKQNDLNPNEIIGDYWTNRGLNPYYGPKQKRPGGQEFKYINNQGGWMATRDQLWTWHTEVCPGGFLPPYEAPHYRFDGLDMRNVEWYSGAMQLSTIRHACNMQRIILLDPQHFSKSLIYHTANNKQRQLAQQGRRESFTKANTLLGQLNAVKKKAEQEMKQSQ